jgi:hypothetical protein
MLDLVPLTLREAHAFVKRVHRHHRPARGGKFAIGASRAGEVVGVVVVGRPVSRQLQAGGWTAEVLRLAVVEGVRNACSFLYAAAWRASRAMGYRRLVTYILGEESGVSLRAAGWRCVGEAGGGSWSRDARPRVDLHPTQQKLRFEVCA